MEALSERLVQRVFEREGNKIPERYIQKEKICEGIDGGDELWNELVIDFSLLFSSDDELNKLKSALSNWGCFLVKNHGIKTSFLEEFIDVSKQFYGLPIEEKLKNSSADNPFQGYGTDSEISSTQGYWNDRMYLTLHPEKNRCVNLWPEKPDNFREFIKEYADKILIVIEGIYKAMAMSLKLEEEDFFYNQMKKGSIYARLTMYPPCPCPELVMGIPPHTDGSLITALLGEPGVEGLEIQKDGRWYKVPDISGTIFFNLGDFGEVTTNGVFKSAVHRVVTNPKGRISWAAFVVPGGNIKVGPRKECITENNPQIYKYITMKEYDQIIRNFVRGSRPLPLDFMKL